jgi:phosphate-selective porin OprO/OprP
VEGGAQVQNFYASGEYFWYGIDRNVDPCSSTAPVTCPSTLINPANVLLSNPHFNGYYVEGSWVITGEPRKYNQVNGAFDGPVPAYPFNPAAGTWGAFELAARFSDLNLNYLPGSPGTAPGPSSVRGGDQQIFTVGLNWYLNPTIRFMADYQHVHINRLNPDSSPTGSFTAPIGAQIGQTYDTVELRSQLQF